jgi:hypothetical protein
MPSISTRHPQPLPAAHRRPGRARSSRARLGADAFDVLRVLTQRVRVLAVDQVARHWFGGEQRARARSRRLCRDLERRGLVEVREMVAHEPLRLSAPLVRWEPGLPLPEWSPVVTQLRRRWTGRPGRVTVLHATRAAAALCSGFGGRGSRRPEVSHDLSLSELFLRLRCSHPELAATWISEAALLAGGWGRRCPVPDATITPACGTVFLEMGGSYKIDKLQCVLTFCLAHNLSLEVW